MRRPGTNGPHRITGDAGVDDTDEPHRSLGTHSPRIAQAMRAIVAGVRVHAIPA